MDLKVDTSVLKEHTAPIFKDEVPPKWWHLPTCPNSITTQPIMASSPL
jgi:hypothetical protein